MSSILVLGAGELGSQVLSSLARYEKRSPTKISVLLRPSSISSPDPQKAHQIRDLQNLSISVVPGDIEHDTLERLTEVFTPFDTIISCTGFAAGKGTQLKITRAVLASGAKRYVPWQFGVDYDVIGRGSGHGLFDEQLDVRELLRSQSQAQTKWAIISTGMFTSFLFESSFGVVDLSRSSVCALGSWENRVTVTTAGDIGLATAEAVLGDGSDSAFSDRPVYIGGDTISYAQLAELIESVTGRTVSRRCLTVQEVEAELARDTENALAKYQLVFGQGRGVAWDLAETWNWKTGMRFLTAEEWARRNLAA
ncbi:NmrA-like family [Aspergillus sp. HF37]|nr:NmrA-like family [Aspergillus sp. HF37]